MTLPFLVQSVYVFLYFLIFLLTPAANFFLSAYPVLTYLPLDAVKPHKCAAEQQHCPGLRRVDNGGCGPNLVQVDISTVAAQSAVTGLNNEFQIMTDVGRRIETHGSPVTVMP